MMAGGLIGAADVTHSPAPDNGAPGGQGVSAEKTFRALGLMSVTSLDGVDAALIETDGHAAVTPGAWLTIPYDAGLRERLRATLGGRAVILEMSSAGVAGSERNTACGSRAVAAGASVGMITRQTR